MTVSYNLQVADASGLAMLKLLLNWRGSLWKAVWKSLLVWLLLYAVISAIHRHLQDEQKMIFNQLADYFDEHMQYIPLNFMLGFFTSEVIRRWNVYITSIGLLDNVSLAIASYLRGTSEEMRMLRRNLVRYCVLAQTLLYRDISMQVRNRFPTLDTVVVGRYMLPHEKERYEGIRNEYGKAWIPIAWAVEMATEARQNGQIDSDYLLASLIKEIAFFKSQLSILSKYDWVPLPIMYPQLIFLAVHTYFLCALFARQYTDAEKIDLYFPFIPVMEFIFYIGWTKVAQGMMNPMGDEDDDFECNWILDRNLKTGFDIVDTAYGTSPDVRKDELWGTNNEPLYAENSRPVNALVGSTANVDLPEDVSEVAMVTLHDIDSDDQKPADRRFSQRRISIVPINRQKLLKLEASSRRGFFSSLRRRCKKIFKSSSGKEYDNESECSGHTNGYFYSNNPQTPPPQRRVTFVIDEDHKRKKLYETDIDDDSSTEATDNDPIRKKPDNKNADNANNKKS